MRGEGKGSLSSSGGSRQNSVGAFERGSDSSIAATGGQPAETNSEHQATERQRALNSDLHWPAELMRLVLYEDLIGQTRLLKHAVGSESERGRQRGRARKRQVVKGEQHPGF